MKAGIAGVGVWGSGIGGWIDFIAAAPGAGGLESGRCEPPPVTMIPTREKRRVPMISRIAIEAAHQACEMAGADPAELATVFASCMADTDVTDYMCRTLNTVEKAMSPTRFHNSVHNATSGYWSIFCGGHQPGGFICGWTASFAVGLTEAMTFVQADGQPTLLVCYDIANTAPMSSAFRIDSDLAIALLLAPDSAGDRSLSAAFVREPETAVLQPDGRNPVSVGLHLLDAFRSPDAAQLAFEFSPDLCLQVRLAAAGSR